MTDPARLAAEEYCYLTTTGRVTGCPHEIEIWFALVPAEPVGTLYMLSGGGDRADWVKNLRQDPKVTVRIAGATFSGRAREPENEEDELTRRLLVEKYERVPGRLAGWRKSSLPVAVDLDRE